MKQQRVSWLNLHLYIPQRDVRKIIYSMLNKGDRIVVQFAHSSVMSSFQSYNLNIHCAQYGYVDLIKWARSKGCTSIYNETTGRIAATYGRLEILQWITSIGELFDANSVTTHAAIGGHLHILKWLHTHKFLQDENQICYYAAKGGHLHVIEWSSEHCHMKGGVNDFETQKQAVEYGHLHILKWMHQNDILIDVFWCLYYTVRHSHYDLFMWLITTYELNLNQMILQVAVKGGNADILKALRNLGYGSQL
jgi:hypothetical protein